MNLSLQKSESRHEDLSVIGHEATKPLLRQIESLQIQNNASLKNWEALEKSMNNRVKDAELGRSESIERERILKEEKQQLLIRLQNFENQLSHLKNDKTILTVELEECKRAVESERDKLYNLSASSNLANEKHDIQIQQMKTAFEVI